MKNNEKLLLGAACFLAGTVAGFLIAPINKGIYCGNHSGNNFTKEDEKSLEDLEELNNELGELDK